MLTQTSSHLLLLFSPLARRRDAFHKKQTKMPSTPHDAKVWLTTENTTAPSEVTIRPPTCHLPLVSCRFQQRMVIKEGKSADEPAVFSAAGNRHRHTRSPYSSASSASSSSSSSSSSSRSTSSSSSVSSSSSSSGISISSSSSSESMLRPSFMSLYMRPANS